jgi:hypothetical protein
LKAQGHHYLLLAGALALFAAAVVIILPWSGAEKAPPIRPLAIIPVGAAFVLDVDVARLRKSATGAELSRLGFERLSPAGPSSEFQPLRDVDTVVVAVAGGARLVSERRASVDPDELVVVASGRFMGNAAADAAVTRIRERGGSPVRTMLGSFVSVRDLLGSGEVATRDGLLVLGDGAYLRAVLAAAEGLRATGRPSEQISDHVHAELRRTFGRGALATATLTLPEGSLEAALGDPEAHRSPLALVRSAAVRVSVEKDVDIDAELICASEENCAKVAEFLARLREDLERELGSNTPFRHFDDPGRRDGARVSLSLKLSLEDVRRYFAPSEKR